MVKGDICRGGLQREMCYYGWFRHTMVRKGSCIMGGGDRPNPGGDVL